MKDEPVSLSLSGIKEAETVSIRGGQIWGGSNVPDDLKIPTTVLAPGNYAPMPHGEDDQWVSNIGIIDGKPHVQIGKVFGKEFGSSDASLALMTPDGKIIQTDYELYLFGNGDCRLLDLKKNDYGDAVYKYEEAVFSIDTEKLDGYTLLLYRLGLLWC